MFHVHVTYKIITWEFDMPCFYGIFTMQNTGMLFNVCVFVCMGNSEGRQWWNRQMVWAGTLPACLALPFSPPCQFCLACLARCDIALVSDAALQFSGMWSSPVILLLLADWENHTLPDLCLAAAGCCYSGWSPPQDSMPATTRG